jgi:hypothetical protein
MRASPLRWVRCLVRIKTAHGHPWCPCSHGLHTVNCLLEVSVMLHNTDLLHKVPSLWPASYIIYLPFNNLKTEFHHFLQKQFEYSWQNSPVIQILFLNLPLILHEHRCKITHLRMVLLMWLIKNNLTVLFQENKVLVTWCLWEISFWTGGLRTATFLLADVLKYVCRGPHAVCCKI